MKMSKYARIPNDVRDDIIRRLRNGNEKRWEIAKSMNVSQSTVNSIAHEIGIRKIDRTCKDKPKAVPKPKRNAARKERGKPGSQLCWDCAKATGLCPWSRMHRPVEGWTAEKVETNEFTTYHITACPLFING